jgi:hypothetical protein
MRACKARPLTLVAMMRLNRTRPRRARPVRAQSFYCVTTAAFDVHLTPAKRIGLNRARAHA